MRGRDDRESLPDPVALLLAGALLALVVGWLGWARWTFLASSPFPFGIDGYFYPVQLRSLLESGTLYYSSAPLALWLMAPLAAVGGEVWAVKVVAVGASALVAVPAYGIARELESDRGPAIAAAAIAAAAPASFYMATEFVKNGVGVFVAMSALWAVLWAARRSNWRAFAIAIALGIAAWLTHKSAAGLVAVGVTPLAFAWCWRAPKRRSAVLALGVGALLTVAALMPERFVGATDIELLAGLFSGQFDARLPTLTHADGKAIFLGHGPMLAFFTAVTFFVLEVRRPGSARRRYVASGFAVLALITALPVLDVGDPNALGFRLRLLSFVSLAILAGPVLTSALARLTGSQRAAACLALAGFVVAFHRAPESDVVVVQHPALVVAVKAAAAHIGPGDLVVTPERRLAFMTTWFTRAAAQTSQPSRPAERSWRLLPLPYLSHPAIRNELAAARSSGAAIHSLHPLDPLGLILIAEPAWQELLANLPPPIRAHYAAWPTY